MIVEMNELRFSPIGDTPFNSLAQQGCCIPLLPRTAVDRDDFHLAPPLFFELLQRITTWSLFSRYDLQAGKPNPTWVPAPQGDQLLP
jgi:hypothetical protein